MLRIFNLYVSRRTVALVCLEALLIAGAVVCGLAIRFWGDPPTFLYYLRLRDFIVQTIVFVSAIQLCFYYGSLYDLNGFHGRIEEAVALGQSIGAACLILALIYFVLPDLLLGRGVFFISVVLAPAILMCTRRGLDRIWKHTRPAENILILGDGALANAVAEELDGRKDLNTRMSGFFPLEVDSGATSERNGAIARLGEELRTCVGMKRISRIVIAVEDRRNVLPIRDLVRLRVEGVRIEEAHTTIAALTGRVWLQAVKPSWFIFSDGFRRSPTRLVVKRTIDVAVTLVGLLVSLPVMAAVAAAIKIDSKGPILYRQTRVGLRGRCFQLLKFRSMRTDAEANGAQWAVDNDPRVTRVGRYLRKFRLDELPQLINIIRADMSLVGPRPERPEFVEELRKHISYYDERHTVRPGLTGWAQTQYRYGASVEDAIRKMEYDLFYLKSMSTVFDCVILLNTVRIVLTGEGSK